MDKHWFKNNWEKQLPVIGFMVLEIRISPTQQVKLYWVHLPLTKNEIFEFKVTINFESIFEIFVNFKFIFEVFVNFEFFCQWQMKLLDTTIKNKIQQIISTYTKHSINRYLQVVSISAINAVSLCYVFCLSSEVT